jgi:uncharacterized protein (TIGR02271 family)
MLRRDSEIATGREISPEASQTDLERLIGYDVTDNEFEPIGNVTALWADRNSQAAFVGVQSGWLAGKTHVVPAYGATVNDHDRKIRLAYFKRDIKGAPSYDPKAVLDLAKEREIFGYFQRKGPQLPELKATAAPTALAASSYEAQRESAVTREATREAFEDTNIPLHEERLKVGKREVEGDGVRLRKIVRTETVQQGVDLRHEEVVVERIPARDMKVGAKAFQNEEFYIPLRHEEVIIEKEARVREEFHARKAAKMEHQTVSGEVRKEDIEFVKQEQRRPEQRATR